MCKSQAAVCRMVNENPRNTYITPIYKRVSLVITYDFLQLVLICVNACVLCVCDHKCVFVFIYEVYFWKRRVS